MLGRLALISIRHRRWIFLLIVVLTAGAIASSGSLADRLKSEGFEDPNSESAKTSVEIAKQFNTGNPNVTFLIEPRSGNVDDAAVRDEAVRVVGQVRSLPGAAEVTSYWTTPGAAA